jgi:hypothetical protein
MVGHEIALENRSSSHEIAGAHDRRRSSLALGTGRCRAIPRRGWVSGLAGTAPGVELPGAEAGAAGTPAPPPGSSSPAGSLGPRACWLRLPGQAPPRGGWEFLDSGEEVEGIREDERRKRMLISRARMSLRGECMYVFVYTCSSARVVFIRILWHI